MASDIKFEIEEHTDRYKHLGKSSKVNLVREEYKRYKRRVPPPDFSNVIDFNNPETLQGKVKKIVLDKGNIEHCTKSGLRDPRHWDVFEVLSCPGFLFITNPFQNGVQHYFIQRSLKDFPCKPNITNLDAHFTVNEGETIWDSCERNGIDLMERLRWAHLGYQFDYNNVEYKPDIYYGFPQDLAKLTAHIATVLGYPYYQPQSGVVNYYPLGSSMGGHVDKYENDLSQPLISLSFGQSAIYLIGGKTSDVRPEALFVKSGDIIVMTGQSRLAYHAVPCIVKVNTDSGIPECLNWDNCDNYGGFSKQNDKSGGLSDDCSVCSTYYEDKDNTICSLASTEDDWATFMPYLSATRININVRQVHKPEENIKLHLT